MAGPDERPCRGLLGAWASWWQGSKELRAAELLSNTKRREARISTCLEAAEALGEGALHLKPIREVPQGARGAGSPPPHWRLLRRKQREKAPCSEAGSGGARGPEDAHPGAGSRAPAHQCPPHSFHQRGENPSSTS